MKANEVLADIIEEAREIFKWNEKLVHELDAICAPMYIKSKIEEPVMKAVEVVRRCPLRLPQEKFRLPIAMVLLVLLWLVKRFYWE